MSRIAGLLAVAVALGPAAAAAQPAADTLTYRVKAGDTLGLIAAEYYGDRTKTLYLVTENRITKPGPLKPGQRLRVPVSRQIVSDEGDTFDLLAKAWLGDARRGEHLATMNHLAYADGLAAGMTLTIPFTLLHVAPAPETVDQIAQRFLGDAKHAELVRTYNFAAATTVNKDQSMLVPVFTAHVQDSKLPALDRAALDRRATREGENRDVATALAEARRAWDAGAYREVIAKLAPIQTEYLDADVAVAVSVLLGCAHVAYPKETAAALAAFKRALLRRPAHQLSAFDYSPKILPVWEQARAGQP